MQLNHQKITGVLHHTHSAEHYTLRRYLPEPEHQLAALVEQFWMVDWDLRDKPDHLQHNLPDPSFHLVIEQHKGTCLLGPVSAAYAYTMSGRGRVIGVKFHPGALGGVLQRPLADYVDTELALPLVNEAVFSHPERDFVELLAPTTTDEQIVARLSQWLQSELLELPGRDQPSTVQEGNSQLQQLITRIRLDENIHRVEQLAQAESMSVRAVQRLFKRYLGLSPKWLIRKYRLHWALDALEQEQMSLSDLAYTLGYSDQSHLIRDFKLFTGNTPGQYVQQSQRKQQVHGNSD